MSRVYSDGCKRVLCEATTSSPPSRTHVRILPVAEIGAGYGLGMLDDDRCYEALRARDARFDGVFFVGVSTTGIYCRPVCPARTPGRDRCAFYGDPVSAEKAGFRACLRCRPELAPGNAPADSGARLLRRALARIESGALIDGSLDDLAGRLGVSGRHLRRVFDDGLGTSPLAWDRSRRVGLARQLLRETALPVHAVGEAVGYASVRSFHAAFRAVSGRAPSDVRRGATVDEALVARLSARPPFDGAGLLRFLAGRAIPGVERVEADRYLRTVRIGPHTGWISVDVEEGRVIVRLAPSLSKVVVQVMARVRALFDLDARPDLIADHLAADPLLEARVRANPGLRVPGAFDPFELAVRAVLGQQVSVKGATTLSGRLVERFGSPAPEGPLPRLFPRAEELARAPVEALRAVGLPEARARTLSALSRAVAEERVDLEAGADPDEAMAALCELPGIGPWTASYVAMRALHWPDAFPAGDLAVKKALGVTRERDAVALAERWRPWRAYAVMHLWTGE